MKSIIFNLLEQVVTDAHGEDIWDDLLAGAGLEGAYTSLGNYPDEDLLSPVSAASEHQRIFDRFYRGDNNVTLRTRGLGIGLAVVKSLTEAMGGTVAVACPETGGTVFRVALPTAAP